MSLFRSLKLADENWLPKELRWGLTIEWGQWLLDKIWARGHISLIMSSFRAGNCAHGGQKLVNGSCNGTASGDASATDLFPEGCEDGAALEYDDSDDSTIPFLDTITPKGWDGPFYGKFLRGNVSGRKKDVGRFETFEEAVKAASKIEECNGITYEPGDKTHPEGFFLRLGCDGLETQKLNRRIYWADADSFVSWTKANSPACAESVYSYYRAQGLGQLWLQGWVARDGGEDDDEDDGGEDDGDGGEDDGESPKYFSPSASNDD